MSVTSVIWLITAQRAFSLFLCTLLGEPIVIATLHRTQSCKSWGFTFAQGLMFYVLYSWIHSLHSWRINVDILRPRCFLCCASKDRKWSSWLLIGWGGKKKVMVWYERQTRTKGNTDADSLCVHHRSTLCIFNLISSIFFLLTVSVSVWSHMTLTRKETGRRCK